MFRDHSIRRTAILLAGLLLIAGCTQRQTRGQAEASASRQVTVEVENNNWATVVVYAVVNDQRIRLGEVNTATTASLRTPAGVDPSTVDFKLHVDPIGQPGDFTTPSLSVYGGARLLLIVENDLRNSRVRII